MIYFVVIILIYLLHLLLKLNFWICVGLGIYSCFMIPRFRKRYRQMKNYQSRFYDVSLYLDTLLYAFVKEEKVELAVRDVRYALPEG